MKDLTPLKSKNGESEWPYEYGKYIAVMATHGCAGCDFRHSMECVLMANTRKMPHCNDSFEVPIIYVEKPAES